MLLQGVTFVNQYMVLKTLGRGAFGKVKLSLNVDDRQLYAVKVVSKSLLRRAPNSKHAGGSLGGIVRGDLMPEACQEVDILRGLSHPNVVRLVEVIGAYCASHDPTGTIRAEHEGHDLSWIDRQKRSV